MLKARILIPDSIAVIAIVALALAAGCMTRPDPSKPLKPVILNARQLPASASAAELREAIDRRARELEADGVPPRDARAMAEAEYARNISGPVPRMNGSDR